jgi:hypothetical protein
MTANPGDDLLLHFADFDREQQELVGVRVLSRFEDLRHTQVQLRELIVRDRRCLNRNTGNDRSRSSRPRTGRVRRGLSSRISRGRRTQGILLASFSNAIVKVEVRETSSHQYVGERGRIPVRRRMAL